jgi:hypothetical protein
MTRLTWFEGFVLLAFWIGGLTAFLIGGIVAVGQLLKVLLVLVLWWVGRELWREYYETVRTGYYREQVFRSWRENSRRKGME